MQPAKTRAPQTTQQVNEPAANRAGSGLSLPGVPALEKENPVPAQGSVQKKEFAGRGDQPVQRKLWIGEQVYKNDDNIPDNEAGEIDTIYDAEDSRFRSGDILRAIYFQIRHEGTFGKFNSWQEVYKYAELQLEIEGHISAELNTDEGIVDNELGTAEENIEFLNIMNQERLFKILGLKKHDSAEVVRNVLPQYYTALEGQRLTNLAKVWQDFAQWLSGIEQESVPAQNVLPQDKYEGIKQAGNYVLANFPPGQYEYIGLGASPLPVMAYLKLNGCEIYDVPVSGLSQYKSNIDDELTDVAKKQNLARFLDAHLGGFDASKRTLVLDYSSGGSLYVAEYMLGVYLNEKYNYNKNHIVPLSLRENDGQPFPASTLGASNITSINLHTPEIAALGPDLDRALYKDLGYRSTDKKYLADVLAGNPELEMVIGGFERLQRDLQIWINNEHLD